MSRLIPLAELDYSFPFERSSVYTGHSQGRYTWLTRVGPDGHRGRHLWVDVEGFNQFCENRGIRYRIEPAILGGGH